MVFITSMKLQYLKMRDCMNRTAITNGLIVYKEVVPKKYGDLLYIVIRERMRKNRQPTYIPIVRFLKYKKSFIKMLLGLDIGDVINIFGELTYITARVSIPELKPPFRDFKKLVVYIKDLEFVRHVDIAESKIDQFINIEDDDLLDELGEIDIEEFEKILDKKLGVDE